MKKEDILNALYNTLVLLNRVTVCGDNNFTDMHTSISLISQVRNILKDAEINIAETGGENA